MLDRVVADLGPIGVEGVIAGLLFDDIRRTVEHLFQAGRVEVVAEPSLRLAAFIVALREGVDYGDALWLTISNTLSAPLVVSPSEAERLTAAAARLGASMPMVVGDWKL